MKVKIMKVRESALLPTKAHPTDAGYDLYADTYTIDEYGNAVYGTGVAMEIPQGYVGLIFPRSSIYKYDLMLSNAVGVIDSGYRGEIMAKFRKPLIGERYRLRDRIAQIIIMPYPEVTLEEVDALSESDRGVGGYGSSGA